MKISIPTLIILLILGILLGLIYIVYCYLQKQQCAVCGTPAEMKQPPRMGNINGWPSKVSVGPRPPLLQKIRMWAESRNGVR